MTGAEIALAIQLAQAAIKMGIDLFGIAKANGADIDTEGLLAEYNALQEQVQAYKPIAEDPNAGT